jgi:hypothetical protein
MALALVVSTTSGARGDPAPESTSDPEPVASRDDLEEVEEAIRVLADAGVPPTREELARFLTSVDNADPHGSLPGFPFSVHGSARVRLGHFQYEGMDHYGKFALETRGLRVRARIREYRTGLRETTGIVEVGGDPVELRVGEVGLSQGHGLLIGPPGRGSSLTADSGFASPAERMVSWLGSIDPAALSGFGVRARYGTWCLRFVNGDPGRSAGGPTPPTTVVQLGNHRDDWRISVAGLAGNQERGASLAGGLRNRSLSGSFETLIWQVAPGIPPAAAAVLHVGWHPARGSGMEGLLGFADLDEAPGLANRPAVLTGWDGRGFALRGFTRTGTGVVLRAMVHLGRHLDRTGSRSRKEKFLVDLQAGKKLSSQVDLAVRYRSTDFRAWNWSERYPWQPPRAAASQRRTIISAQVVLERTRVRGRLLVRSYGLDKETGNGRRSLISLTGRYSIDKAWKLRGAWVTAWGDPVDLVSAISPLTGMVLPRHWGRWRSETVLGLEWVRGGARIQAAGSLRHPEPGSEERAVQTIWVEAGIRW